MKTVSFQLTVEVHYHPLALMKYSLPIKEKYFRTLHRRLGQKYFIGSGLVYYLREAYITRNLTVPRIVEEIKTKIANKKRAIKLVKVEKLEENSELKEEYNRTMLYLQAQKNLLLFLEQCTPAEWADLTQLTPFDEDGALQSEYNDDFIVEKTNGSKTIS